MFQFFYPYQPISSIESLAVALHTTADELTFLKNNADKFYFLIKEKTKKDNTKRYIYDVKERLKRIHSEMCNAIFKKVQYPNFIQGSVRGRDFINNANLHCNKHTVFVSDISNFFPSVSAKIVFQVFVGFFHFSKIVAEYLTALSCYKGFLVQGSKVSSYICNLALWNRECVFADDLKRKGLTYSRYVDDITISSNRKISNSELSNIIRKLVNMLNSIGVKVNRRKQKFMFKGNKQKIMNLNIAGRKASIPKEERNKVRAMVHKCEELFSTNTDACEYSNFYNSTMGKINFVGRLHKDFAFKMKERLEKIAPNK